MSLLKQFVLPFAVKSENREGPFSGEAELAAVFALSELERKSGGLGNKAEKSVYILKVGYPLWFIVRDNFAYVFDGLDRACYNGMYGGVSQAEFKIEEFDVPFRIYEAYVQFLVNYQKNFGQLQNKEEVSWEGLIVDYRLLGEMDSYRREASEVYGQYSGLFLPVLEEKKVVRVVDQIEALQISFREKVEKLGQLSELISKTTAGYIEGFNFESKAIAEETEAKTKAQKEIINPKIEKITINYKKQVEQLEKNTDKKQQPLEKQKKRIEKTIKEVESNIERYSKQAKIQSQKGNKRSEDSLKKKLKKEKQELDDLQKQQKNIEKQLKTLIEQKTNEYTTLKCKFDQEIQTERQPIIDLEILRDKKQEKLGQENLKLEKITTSVLEEINQIANEWKNNLTSMKLLGIKLDPELKYNTTIMYVPFYITAYRKPDLKDKRYFVFSPALVNSLGFSSKLKGFLGRAKIKDLFNERFEAVSALGEKLQMMITSSNSNTDFEAQLEELAQKSNLLNMKTELKDGLLLLKEEGWLSDAEHQAMLSSI
jgi:hypothetical protein